MKSISDWFESFVEISAQLKQIAMIAQVPIWSSRIESIQSVTNLRWKLSKIKQIRTESNERAATRTNFNGKN